MDKTEVLDTLAERERTSKSVEIKRISPVFDGKTRELIVNGKYTLARDHLFNQLCGHLKAPASFLKQTDEDLGERIVKHLSKNVKNLHLLTVGDKAARIYTQKIPYTSPTALVKKVLDKNPDCEYLELDQSIDFFQLGLRSEKRITQPVVGDVVKGGVNLRFSEWGLTPPEVETASYRLICTNGMVHADFLHAISISAKVYSEMMDNIMRAVATGFDIFETVVAPKMATAAATQLDPMQAIRRIARQHKLNPQEIDRVMAAYAAEPATTMWGVSNAFTRAASQFESYSVRHRLQQIGGGVVKTADKPHCQACAAEM